MRRFTLSALAAAPLLLFPVIAQGATSCVKLGAPILAGKDQVCNVGEGGAIVEYLKMVLQFLSAGVGIVVVLMLVIAGVQYITAVGDPGNIKKAKERIVNAITALLLFIFGYAILNFLIPGGLFG